MVDISDDDLLAELGAAPEAKKQSARTPREERIIAGFEDIVRFREEHGRVPQHGEERDIFERIYAVRLDRLRAQEDCRTLLQEFDRYGLLATPPAAGNDDEMDDDALLAELGLEPIGDVDLTELTHVKPRAEVRAAEEVADRTPCVDFETFKPLFARVKDDLDTAARETRRFGEDADVKQGEFFILGGQVAFVAALGDEFKTDYGRLDRRLRVVFDNGTESDLLLRSFQRALYKDDAGRRITDPNAGPLFGGAADDEDLASGTIYVLRSKSDHPDVAAHRDLIHKVGVTGGTVEARIAQAALDSTYLLADVEVVATYKLFNINRTRLENVLHRVLSPARLDLTIQDRFGNPVKPKEWYLVPLHVIDEVVARVKDGTIRSYEYDPSAAMLRPFA
ncbi:GIY-YIG nuclease family protein [Rhizobium leguminosarum]|uniref:GIY-YIG nuclease family protein n=1 Tax=Rhizobium TaxID=379 RepID=UPI0013B8D22A|nr:GIY-YIG nuclease family protein [Rhizobium leguminosarum]MBY5387689.1 GIY-YIG nuclease family protein [Rhizobium leguminosarum]MBY5428285.1 GIY-YIG nuclease family protein [Rhizobium leguminosarum]NEK45498.1 GIY-YIG nuclease family protein [Rhizobium leguminosarum]